MAFLPALAAIASIAGVGISTLSAAQQAKAQAGAMKAQAEAAEIESTSIQQQAAEEERQSRRRSALAIGKQTAISAASGVDISMGSPLFMELDSIREAEMDALNIRHSGVLGTSAKAFESKLARFQGRRYRQSIPGIYAGGALQVGSILSQWMGPSSGSGSSSGTRATHGPGF